MSSSISSLLLSPSCQLLQCAPRLVRLPDAGCGPRRRTGPGAGRRRGPWLRGPAVWSRDSVSRPPRGGCRQAQTCMALSTTLCAIWGATTLIMATSLRAAWGESSNQQPVNCTPRNFNFTPESHQGQDTLMAIAI